MRPLAFVSLLALAGAAPPALAAQAPAPAQPARPLCVATPDGMRLLDTVAARLPDGSVVLRTSERGELTRLVPGAVGYAAPADGFAPEPVPTFAGEPIRPDVLLGASYHRYGPARRVRPDLLVRIGERQGISVFVEPGADVTRPPEILYVLVAPDCRFQPYQRATH